MSSLKTVLVSETTAQLYIPITFMGPPGQPAPDTPFLDEKLTRTLREDGCRLADRQHLADTTSVTRRCAAEVTLRPRAKRSGLREAPRPRSALRI